MSNETYGGRFREVMAFSPFCLYFLFEKHILNGFKKCLSIILTWMCLYPIPIFQNNNDDNNNNNKK